MFSYYLIVVITFIGCVSGCYIVVFADKHKKNYSNKLFTIIFHIAIWIGAFFSAWFTTNYAGNLDGLSYVCLGIFIAVILAEIIYCIFSKKIYSHYNNKQNKS